MVQIDESLTPGMAAIQNCLVDLINACLLELKQTTKVQGIETLSLQEAIGQNFDQSVKQKLNPVWDKMGKKSKQLLNDLTTLRRCLSHLLTYDCVTFYRYLLTLSAAGKNRNSATGGTGQIFNTD